MNRHDEAAIAAARAEAVALARSILRGEVGVLEGARAMLVYREAVGLDEWDEDMLVFVAIESQEDHLPVGRMREHWSAAALARLDPEITQAEAFHRVAAFDACRALVRKLAETPAD